MDETPDLTLYLAMHRQMRIDSHRLTLAAERATRGDRSDRLHALRRYAAGFARELALHHVIEDDLFFPDLAGRVPTVRPTLEALATDHHDLAALIERLPVDAAAMAEATATFSSAKRALVEVTGELSSLLDRHLDVEDADVLPLFAEHYSAAEYDALHDGAVAFLPKAAIPFAVPWALSAVPSDELRAQLLAEAPRPLRIAYRLTNGRFQRMRAAAFAGLLDAVPASVAR